MRTVTLIAARQSERRAESSARDLGSVDLFDGGKRYPTGPSAVA
jgi:hypothetical protein